jgi:hypothetical protein
MQGSEGRFTDRGTGPAGIWPGHPLLPDSLKSAAYAETVLNTRRIDPASKIANQKAEGSVHHSA